MQRGRELRLVTLLALGIGATVNGGCDDGGENAPSDAGAEDILDEELDTTEPIVRPDQPAALVTDEEILDLVNPFFGAGGLGFSYGGGTPAAQVPLGMVRLGPDTGTGTSYAPFDHTSGYYFPDDFTLGFSHLHFVGTGVPDYGNLRMLPLGEAPNLSENRWATLMDKESEEASPGYYSVELPESQVRVELTASAHFGVHRYTALSDTTVYLLWDTTSAIEDGEERFGASQTTRNADGLQGFVTYGGPYTGRSNRFTVFFDAVWSQAPDAVSLWTSADGEDDEATEVSGFKNGALLRYDLEAGDAVEFRVGIAPVDAAQAEDHREAAEELSFEEVLGDAEEAWLERLSRIRIAAHDEDVREVFYSALYNCWRMPTMWGGADGAYVGLDNVARENPGFTWLTDLSLWDTFRTLHPLYELIDQETQRNSLLSLLEAWERTGGVPRWPAATSFTSGMIGSSADHLFSSSAQKGISGVDYELALEALSEHALNTVAPEAPGGRRGGIEDYLEYGYVTIEAAGGSVSRTLEFAWADFSLANLAAHLGETELDATFREMSGNWQNVLEPETRFMRGRYRDGTWDLTPAPTSVVMSGGNYTEGSPWHYRFYAPHDVDALIAAWGDEEEFRAELDTFFERAKGINGTDQLDGLLPDPYYWQSNEPDIDAAMIFHHLGASDQATRWVRQIQRNVYGPGPAGLPGNDDGGTMSAWYVLNAIGLHPRVGTPDFYLSMPLVERAEVQLGDSVLVVEAPWVLKADDRWLRVERDGVLLDDYLISQRDLEDATLRFVVVEDEE